MDIFKFSRHPFHKQLWTIILVYQSSLFSQLEPSDDSFYLQSPVSYDDNFSIDSSNTWEPSQDFESYHIPSDYSTDPFSSDNLNYSYTLPDWYSQFQPQTGSSEEIKSNEEGVKAVADTLSDLTHDSRQETHHHIADTYLDYSTRLKNESLAVPPVPAKVFEQEEIQSLDQSKMAPPVNTSVTPPSVPSAPFTPAVIPSLDAPAIVQPPVRPVEPVLPPIEENQPLPAPVTPNRIIPPPVTPPVSTTPPSPAILSTPSSQLPTSSLTSPSVSETTPAVVPLSRPPVVITPTSASVGNTASAASTQPQPKEKKEVSINFNNVAMVEYIRFISRLSNKNFIFDDEDLQFNVTIISEDPTTVENLMAALLQELKIRDLSLIEQGNNILIHRNPRIRAPSRIVMDGTEETSSHASELVTRVFRLNTLDPVKASAIIRPLLSDDALVEVLTDTNNLIITDLVMTVNKVAQLINSLDSPNSGVSIGQYVVRNVFVDSLMELATKILQPIAQGNPFILVPHSASNSIYVVSNAFIVEKALAMLQNLDVNEGQTKILSLENLHPTYYGKGSTGPSPQSAHYPMGVDFQGRPIHAIGLDSQGRPVYSVGFDSQGRPIYSMGVDAEGRPIIFPSKSFPGGDVDAEGHLIVYPFRNSISGGAGTSEEQNTYATQNSLQGGGVSTSGQNIYPPSAPLREGGIGSEGRPSAIFTENRDITPGGVSAHTKWSRDLPVGHIERTLFFIYKLRYRKGDSIEIALRKIATSLQITGTSNADLVSSINSIQWIESSNSLIFTGTAATLEKVRELVLEIDTPLRQVFIEMLVLDTTITDSLSYSVDWINRFGGGTTTGEQGFIQNVPNTASNSFINSSEMIQSTATPPGSIPGLNTILSPLPIATGLVSAGGFAAGVIGTHLTHNGTCFSSIGALVKAIHSDSKGNILLNPKIITEDNNPAEIFVGGTDRYKTQSITNDLGSLVTNNFQFIDVGITLRVTPLIGNNGIITLEITQENTAATQDANNPALAVNQDVNLVQVLTKTRAVTKIHVPNGFFVVFSGMIMDSEQRTYSRIPCLGGIPLIGCFGKQQNTNDSKRSLMLFIRPLIIDTDEDFEDVTRRQQEVYLEKSKFRRSWNYEIDEGLNFLNVKPTDPDEVGCYNGE